MMPSLSLSSSPSSVSTTIRVDKATSELLVGPDWTMNMEICDLCNSNHWMAKDVVKGVKRRLQHKNPRVQLLTLTLLETMVKNCGEYIHHQIAERKILDEMIKIVKKKGDFHVRDKILTLLDSWQEAFGGPRGKYSQYYWACDELRRFGAQFPQRSPRSAPVVTPPVTHPSRASQVGFGMPANSPRRLEEAMTSEVEGLSFSTLESMRNTLELLNDMLQAVNPSDRMAVKDEVIVDLVDRCRTDQKRLMQMITTTTDENLLAQGLEMNDSLQSVLAKHDAIASGTALPDHVSHPGVQQTESPDSSIKTDDVKDKDPAANGKSPVSNAHVAKDNIEEEEEEDEFALLARRHSKAQSEPSQSGTSGAPEDGASSSGSNNALALIDACPPTHATTTSSSKEQDMIDLLSMVLITNPSETPETPTPAPAHNIFESSSNSYVVPWAQPQPQPQPQQLVQSLHQHPNQYHSIQPQMQPQAPSGYSQYGSAYPPPPWEGPPGYTSSQNYGSTPYAYGSSQVGMNYTSPPAQGVWASSNSNTFQYPQYGNHSIYSATNASSMQGNHQSLQHSNSFQNSSSMNGNLHPVADTLNTPSSMPVQGVQALEHPSSFPTRTGNGLAMNGNGSALNGSALVTNGSSTVPAGQKPFVPSYKLFEDLNVLGGAEGKLQSGPYPSASGNPNQNLIAGRR